MVPRLMEFYPKKCRIRSVLLRVEVLCTVDTWMHLQNSLSGSKDKYVAGIWSTFKGHDLGVRERERNAFVGIILSYFEVLDTFSDCLMNWLKFRTIFTSIYRYDWTEGHARI